MEKALLLPRLILVWTVLVSASLAAETGMPDGEYVLRLQRLLHDRPGAWASAQDCFVELQRRDGRWVEAVWAHAPRYNTAEHQGRIEHAEDLAGGASIDVQVEIADDEWVRGGPAVLHLDLKEQEVGWTGTYFGRYRQEPVHGLIDVVRRELPPRLDDLAIASGEHPRVVLRQEQVDRLRQAAATPAGQAVLDTLRRSLAEPVVWHQFAANAGAHAAGHALLYALTGAESSAAKAQELCWERLRKEVGGPPLLAEAQEVVGVALAYDLCHDIWEPAFRTSVTDWLERKAQALVRADALAGKVDAHDRANAITRSAAMLAALAIYRDQGHYPERPAQAVQQRVAPDRGFEPDGDFGEIWRDDRMPEKWLVSGPFFNVLDEDVLADLGGSARARPGIGDTVRFERQERPFRRLKKDWFYKGSGSGDQRAISLLAPIDRAYHTLACYYTVVRFEDERLVRFDLGNSRAVRARAYLAGVPIQDGDFLDVQPGWYPLMVRVEVGATQPWGEIWMRPRFTAVDRRELQALAERGSAAIEAWQEGYDAWVANGRQVVSAADTIAQALRHLRRYLHHGVGEHGLATCGDADQVAAARALLPALAAWQSCSDGGRLVEGPVVERLVLGLALRLAAVDGRPVLPGLGRGDHVLRDPDLFGLAWPQLSATAASQVQLLLGRLDLPILAGTRDPVAAIFAFLHGPDPETNEDGPPPPGVVLDRRQGVLVHRGTDFDGDDLIASLQIGNPVWGAPTTIDDAGSLHLIGCGRRWLVGGGMAGENRISVHDAEAGGHGRLLAHERFGSGGSLTRLDLSDVFRSSDRKGKPLALDYQRQVLIDHASGLPGVAGLLVCHDRIRGSRGHHWQLHVDGDVTIQDGGFEVRFADAGKEAPGWRLTGRVLTPQGARIVSDAGRIRIDAGTDYLVVLVVHREAAPQVGWDDADGRAIRIGPTYRLPWRDGLLASPR